MNDIAALRDAPDEIAGWPDARVRSVVLAADSAALVAAAAALRDAGHGNAVSYSRKVFIPLTKLCRDVCHYCTFAETPKAGPAYLNADEVLAIARAGERAGCREALFTLGDRPEAPTRRRGARSRRWGTTPPFPGSRKLARWFSARHRCCRTSTPASWTPTRPRRCARFR